MYNDIDFLFMLFCEDFEGWVETLGCELKVVNCAGWFGGGDYHCLELYVGFMIYSSGNNNRCKYINQLSTNEQAYKKHVEFQDEQQSNNISKNIKIKIINKSTPFNPLVIVS